MARVENRAQANHLLKKMSSIVILGETFVKERKDLTKSRPRLLTEIESTIPEILIDRSSEAYEAISDRFCDFLPRTYASMVTFCLLSGKRYDDISKDGLDASRLFWQLGHKQDDIIDDPNRTARSGEDVMQDIFNNDGIGHRKTMALLNDKINSSKELKPDDKSYLFGIVASWFDLLKAQEDELSCMTEEDLSFEYCKKHREEQNMMAGRVICAFLNWEDCRTEEGQYVEKALPQFSYMSQLIDDIGDLPEDLGASRPSFVVGALNENPDEKIKISNFIKIEDIRKLSYDVLKIEAPKTTELLDALFNNYRREAAKLGGLDTEVILGIAKLMYFKYSKMKKIIQKINPAWSTF